MSRSIYKNVAMTIFTFGQEAAESLKCEVRLFEDGEIEVSYKHRASPGGTRVYAGQEQGAGHYLLENKNSSGRASLHRFKDSLILEGFWEENTEEENDVGEDIILKGMWRIELDDVKDEVTGIEILRSVSTSSADLDLDEEEEEELGVEEDEEDWGEDEPVRARLYNFALRYGWDVRLSLPIDMTRREGLRLASFVKSLSCDY